MTEVTSAEGMKGHFRGKILREYRAQAGDDIYFEMEGLKDQMTFLRAADTGDAIVYALQAPGHVDIA